ncbi:hemolymph lipopolysaccharide-binding protein [Anabrus simplex]|uniref:hemolymph lipopolysaccharide-binding protein n=1 Tax=Anabrus simplex TaxID=316456 RepID=UPI0035A3745F
MEKHLIYLLLLVVLCSHCGNADVCQGTQETSFTFSITSKRNLSGHWIFMVDTASADPKQSWQVAKPREMGVVVGHKSRSCKDLSTAQLTARATTSYAVTGSPSGYELFPGLGYYKLHTEALTWQEAQDKCIAEGAYLLVINSEQEATVVTTFFSREPQVQNASYEGYAFVGFNDLEIEGQFVTVLGEPLNSSGYAEWYKDKPDGAEEDNCGGVNKDAKYFDLNCIHKLLFICEYND